MRTLLLADKLPHPPRGGRDLRVWQNVVATLPLGPTGVFALHPPDPSAAPLPEIAIWQTSDDPTLTALQSGAAALEWLSDPDSSPADDLISTASASEFATLLEEFDPDVVVLEECFLHRYIELVRETPAGLVFDAHNAEAELKTEMAKQARGPEALIRRRFAERVARIEAETVAAADLVWACSELDASLLEAYESGAPIVVVPNAVDASAYPAATGEPLELVYTASFGAPPSEQAALFLAGEVLPLLPEASLTLAGAHPTPSILAAAEGQDRVSVTGPVADTRPLLAAGGAMPVPLFVGSGTRLKVLEAFASRLPVVSTAKGVEGLAAREGTHYLRAETAREFADALRALATRPAEREQMTAAAHRLVVERYSWEAVGPVIRSSLLETARPPGMGGGGDSAPGGG